MSEQRRTAPTLVVLALGLGLLGLALCVVPRTSAAPNSGPFEGRGSSSVTQLSQRPGTAAADHGRQTVGRLPGQTSGAVISTPSDKASAPVDPRRRNPYNDSSTGGGGGDWTHLPSFPHLGRTFGVEVGDVTGLYPGVEVELPVIFVNPMRAAISVEQATVTASGVAGCGVSNLMVGTIEFDQPVDVPAGSAVAGHLPFGMLADAGDACQGATFTVTVDATAVAG